MTQQPSPDPLGALVKHFREDDLLLSQSDLAWLAGVSRGTISNLETGRVTPDARTWHRIRTALALPFIPLDEARAGCAARLVLPADAVQGIINAIVMIRDRDPELGRRAADRWGRLVARLTREDDQARPADAELRWLADDIFPLVPPGKLPFVHDALRSWGWMPGSGQATAMAPRSEDGDPGSIQELTLTVSNLAEQLRVLQAQAQGLGRLPEEVRDTLSRGLTLSCDVTIPQTSPEVSIINLIVMNDTNLSLAAQHEAHVAAIRWSTILAVATHIVEQQAPDLSPKQIIKALKAGLDAQSPAEVRDLLTQANSGDPLAMYRLARLLSKNGRPDESERWLRRAAEAGHPGALFTLGNLAVEEGRSSEAEHWLRGAADAGHTDAMYQLWVLLRDDAPADARSWLRKAAEAGNRNAMYQLWTLLSRDRDALEAERWLRRAANDGHRRALADLTKLARERGAAAEAARWLHRAAEEGDTSAMASYEIMLYEMQARPREAARNLG